jgi:hypothetical protein
MARRTRDLRIGAIVALCLVWSLGDLPTQSAVAQEGATLAAIEAAWGKREQSTNTFHFEWIVVDTLDGASLPGPPGPGVTHSPTPPKTVTHEARHELTMDGDLFRYTCDAPRWRPDEGCFMRQSYTSVFDGTTCYVHFGAFADGSLPTNSAFPVGYVAKKNASNDLVDYHLWGALLTFRPVYTTTRLLDAPAPWVLTADQGVIAGRRCWLLKKMSGRISDVCWVDVPRASSIARYERMVEGKVLFRVDISLQATEPDGWIPVAWHWTVTGTGPGNARVTKHTINEPVDPAQFELHFPAGTWVQGGLSDNRIYIVRPDGTKRIVTEEEQLRGARYLDLVNTESGEALATSTARGPYGGIVICLVFVIALASILGWVWRRRRYRQSDATQG